MKIIQLQIFYPKRIVVRRLTSSKKWFEKTLPWGTKKGDPLWQRVSHFKGSFKSFGVYSNTT
jgi:hypothetical protein